MFTDRRTLLKQAGLGIAFAAPGAIAESEPRAADPRRPGPLFQLPPRSKADRIDTARFQSAIDLAAAHGGGTVFVPSGRYIVGSVFLRSHVSLWLDNGCVVAMSPDDADYLPAERISFNTGANRATSDFHIALFIGENVEHIAIHGPGVVDCERGRQGSGPKPIALRRCNHVSLQDLTLRNAQNYNISMLGCEFVEIRGIKIHSGKADGIDPDCCRNVVISDCIIDSWDDSLCLKASGALGERGLTENITVTNCILRTASVHFKCGTESCGDFRNIAVSNCLLEGGLGMRHGNPGIALYTVDGGNLQGVSIANITMRMVGTPLAILSGDRDRCALGQGSGMLGDVRIQTVVAVGASLPSVIAGLPGVPIRNISIHGLSVEMNPRHEAAPSPEAVPENPKAYPAPVMFGDLPAFGMYVRHVENVNLSDITFHAPAGETRPDVMLDDVSVLRFRDHERRGEKGPVHIMLKDVRESFVRCVAVNAPPPRAIRVVGSKTSGLYLKGEGAIDWNAHLSVGNEVQKSAVLAT